MSSSINLQVFIYYIFLLLNFFILARKKKKAAIPSLWKQLKKSLIAI